MSEPKVPSPEADDEELLDTGQEEVFSRTEVERGRIEHATEAGRTPHPPEGGQARPGSSSEAAGESPA